MTFRTAALTLALAAFAATALAAKSAKTAGNNFILVDNAGKTIGNASYTIDQTKNGFKVKTRFEYHLAIAPGTADIDNTTNPDMHERDRGAALLSAQDTAEYKLDANGNFLSGFMQNVANQMMTSFQPNKKRDAVTISHMQGGTAGASSDLSLPAPQFLLAPNFDPSAIQMLLTTALTHPHPDSTYLLVVPGTNGSGGDNTLYVIIQPTPDTPAGILDGKPVALKHYLMNYHSGHADLYTDADGTLLDAVMGPLDASYVRDKFTLAKQ